MLLRLSRAHRFVSCTADLVPRVLRHVLRHAAAQRSSEHRLSDSTMTEEREVKSQPGRTACSTPFDQFSILTRLELQHHQHLTDLSGKVRHLAELLLCFAG